MICTSCNGKGKKWITLPASGNSAYVRQEEVLCTACMGVGLVADELVSQESTASDSSSASDDPVVETNTEIDSEAAAEVAVTESMNMVEQLEGVYTEDAEMEKGKEAPVVATEEKADAVKDVEKADDTMPAAGSTLQKPTRTKGLKKD